MARQCGSSRGVFALFLTLGLLVVAHALFHVWRHYRVRDNALRVMAPRALHRFL